MSTLHEVVDLLPLPEPIVHEDGDWRIEYFTTSQMRSYAIAARAVLLQQNEGLARENELLRKNAERYQHLIQTACYGYPSGEGSNLEDAYLVITGTKDDDRDHAERIIDAALQEQPK